MNYTEIDCSKSVTKWNMSFLHSHAYYEIYFLVSGTRKIFIKDKIYALQAPGIIVIPPYALHKTEGDAFERINLCVAQENLSNYERDALDGMSCKITVPEKEAFSDIKKLLELAIRIKNEPHPYSDERLRSVINYIILTLERLPQKEGADSEYSPNLILSVIDYINSNYKRGVSLNELSREFFISKTALCAKFKAVMKCSVNDYILKNKLNRAKELLITTGMSVEEVARNSGFSSANYMGLVFKNKIGASPLSFKKQNEIREDGDRTSIRKRYTPKPHGGLK